MRRKKTSQYKPKDRDEAERKLLKAAQDIFSEKGYEGASTRMIAERSGINLGLISRYFGNKKGLLLAVIEDMCTEAATALPYPPEKELASELNKYAEFSLETFLKQEALFRIVVMQSMTDPGLLKELYQSPTMENMELGALGFRSQDTIARFAGHLGQAPKQDSTAIEMYMATLDYIIMGVLITHYIMMGESKKKCLEYIKQAISNIRIQL